MSNPRCSASTIKGALCKKQSSNGKLFCSAHSSISASCTTKVVVQKVLNPRCNQNTSNGSACQNSSLTGQLFCASHQVARSPVQATVKAPSIRCVGILALSDVTRCAKMAVPDSLYCKLHNSESDIINRANARRSALKHCNGYTLGGRKCFKKAVDGELYCFLHSAESNKKNAPSRAVLFERDCEYLIERFRKLNNPNHLPNSDNVGHHPSKVELLIAVECRKLLCD